MNKQRHSKRATARDAIYVVVKVIQDLFNVNVKETKYVVKRGEEDPTTK